MARDETPVLVVDDEQEYLDDFKTLFSQKFNILTACGAERALEILKSSPAAVVISDHRMPKMSGSELMVEISRLYPETLRILLTGYADIKALEESMSRGEIHRYVSKDVSLEELETVIRQAIEALRVKKSNGKSS